MSGKKEYFPNNWKEYKEADDDAFIPHTFEEIMTWKVAGWELPASVCCVIRAHNRKTNKIKEYIYQRAHAAEEKMYSLLEDPDIELTICDHQSIHHLSHHSTLNNDQEDL